MKTLRINVTKKDIAKGKRREPEDCPVALAIKRQKVAIICVGIDRIWIADKDAISTPKTVQRFIERFDCGNPVKPFSFTLKAQ